MPEILKRCVRQVMEEKGRSEESAFAICISRLRGAGMIKQMGKEWVLTEKGMQHEAEREK